MAGPASVPAVPSPKAIAFFTKGDGRASSGAKHPKAPKLTRTGRFEKRAESLATSARVHGVQTVQEATAALQALPADLKLMRIYFVGHGFDDGFFFSGKPDPQSDFEAASQDQTLMDPASKSSDKSVKPAMTAFIDELVKHVHATERVEIGFLACFTGTGSTVQAVCKAMNKKKHRNFLVGGYQNDYQTEFVFSKDTGKILHWTDGIFDKKTRSTLIGSKAAPNQIPPYEVTCRSDDPIDPLDF